MQEKFPPGQAGPVDIVINSRAVTDALPRLGSVYSYSTDLVGYSALSHRDEALAIELLELHRTWVREILPKHGGIEIETIGDAFLIEFTGVLCVGCRRLNHAGSIRSQPATIGSRATAVNATLACPTRIPSVIRIAVVTMLPINSRMYVRVAGAPPSRIPRSEIADNEPARWDSNSAVPTVP